MSKVIVHRRAAKYLRRLPKTQKDRVTDHLKRLEEKPLELQGVKAMVGDWAGYYRMRIGDIRIIFWFDREEDIVYVDHIGPRGDIYR